MKADGKRLWTELTQDYGIADAGGQALLVVACEALDRMRGAQKLIEKHSICVKTAGGGLKTNPAVATERDARNGFLAAIRQLNLDVQPPNPAPGKPPGTFRVNHS